MKNKSIGILGGGQLCQMLSNFLISQNEKVYFLDPTKNPPAINTGAQHIKKNYDDDDAIDFIIEKCKFITYEFENIPIKTVEKLEKHIPVFPSSSILKIAQNRNLEKKEFINSGIKTPKFIYAQDKSSIEDILNNTNITLPVIIKTNTMGYDGKGQIVLKDKKEIASILNKLPQNTEFIIEEKIQFSKEISVIVGRDKLDNLYNFLPIENIHKNGILDYSIYPARIDEELSDKAIFLAKKFASNLNLTGIMAVEMFIDEKNEIYFNEIAPRPHNSGHLTIESHNESQYSMLGKIILGGKIRSPKSNVKAIMKNILGEFYLKDNYEEILSNINKVDNHYIHIYNKSNPKIGRKM
ncbi:uncharacterized protein METZ01_LOCUS238499, partial [marine metagenome]